MRGLTVIAGAVAGAVAAQQVRERAPFARMLGSSIAAPDAAGWVTDFLNAAYLARPATARRTEDLRLALSILTTTWHDKGHRRLHAKDMVAFHRAFGRRRLASSPTAPRGTLDHDDLLAGAGRLLGGWFADAWEDPARRGWGIVFPTPSQRDAHDPTVRLRAAKVGALTPPELPPSEQVWHTYAPVPVASADAVLELLARPERWPDVATEIGRFTPLRAGGLAGQTFEIEVMAPLVPRLPAYLRAYVTVTQALTTEDPEALHAYVDELNDAMVRIGRDEPPVVPEGATPVAAVELTAHEGHFMGSSRNRVLLYESQGAAWLRAAGTWDEMPLALDQAYRRAGRSAQARFWGQGEEDTSMLHQIAIQAGARR